MKLILIAALLAFFAPLSLQAQTADVQETCFHCRRFTTEAIVEGLT